nr:retrovirus-related Pol polyprotein from transposon TNT 1-94 [Tanacetum cinerariifolium]
MDFVNLARWARVSAPLAVFVFMDLVLSAFLLSDTCGNFNKGMYMIFEHLETFQMRPPLLQADVFCFWKSRFETYVKSKDIDLSQVIQNGDFYFEVEDLETKLMKETAYKLIKEDQKKQLGKNNKAKMTLYNALPRKEYERVFMCKTAKEVWHTLIITHKGNSQVKNCKIDLLTQEYEKFSVSNEETIDSGFTRFNSIATSLKSLDPDYSSKNHMRKFLRALPLKCRAKVYKMVLDNDGVALKTTKEKVKSLALKAKVTREQTIDNSDNQGGSDEYVGEEEAEAFNLMAKNFHKGEEELLRFDKGITKTFEKLLKEKRSLKSEKPKLLSKIKDLEIEVKKLANNKEIVDSGCTKHVTGNRRLFTSYKTYDGGHVVFRSNLKGKVIGEGNISHDSITITNVEHVSGLAFNLISVEYKDDVLEKFKILCKRLENLHDCSIVSIVTIHSSEFDKLQFRSFCKQHGMSYNLSGPFTSQSSEIVERTHHKFRKMSNAMLDEQSIPKKFGCHALDIATCIFNRVYIRKFINKTPYEILRNRKPSLEYFMVFSCKVCILNTKVHLTKFDQKSYEGVFLGYSQTSKACIVLNKETMRIEESLKTTFDESLPEPKSSPSSEYDRINEPIVQDLNGSSSLQVNVLDKGYPKSVKEAKGHLIEQVIGELNERTLRSKTKQA